MHPQRAERGLLIDELADETIVFDRVRHRAHCLNRLAACVWRHCDGQHSLAQLAELVSRELKVEVTEEVVSIALEQLGRKSLLLEPVRSSLERRARRDVLRKLAAAAVLVPAVMTVIAPTAAQAASSVDTCSMESGSDFICRRFSCPGGMQCKNAGGGLARCGCKP